MAGHGAASPPNTGRLSLAASAILVFIDIVIVAYCGIRYYNTLLVRMEGAWLLLGFIGILVTFAGLMRSYQRKELSKSMEDFAVKAYLTMGCFLVALGWVLKR